MLQENRTNTTIGLGGGILLQVAGQVLTKAMPGLALIGFLICLVGLAFFIWGCMNYAEGKGYDKVLGLLGLLSCIGLIVLWLLPDKNE